MSCTVPRTPEEPPRRRTIKIESLNRGFVVSVDCHSFAFEKAEDVGKYIALYLKNPGPIEKKWFNNELFK